MTYLRYGALPPPGSASNMYRIFIVFLSPITVLNCRSNYQEAKGWDAIYWIQPRHNLCMSQARIWISNDIR
jgi:anaerobic selenocysteine-containing dehydrogenase